eukprot:SAG31_NODE_417_length_15907_cov_6.901759_15_plen_161_part_00
MARVRLRWRFAYALWPLIVFAAAAAAAAQPGHGDWEQGEPKIMVTDGPCSNTMNPTVDETYTFLGKFLKEVGTIFPEQNLFLGGDEVSGDCCERALLVSPHAALPPLARVVAAAVASSDSVPAAFPTNMALKDDCDDWLGVACLLRRVGQSLRQEVDGRP